MKKSIELRGIELKIKDIQFTLSLDEARELKDVLCELLGPNQVHIPYPVYPTTPIYQPFISTTDTGIRLGSGSICTNIPMAGSSVSIVNDTKVPCVTDPVDLRGHVAQSPGSPAVFATGLYPPAF